MRKSNRHGQHRDDLVQLGAYITPELKALAQVTANELKTNMVECLKNGIFSEASRAGIVRNGDVVQKYKPIIDAYADGYRARKASRKRESK